MIVAWALFPVVLGALCLGLGELVGRAAGRRPPAALLLPYGLAAMVVVATTTTAVSRLAPLTIPLVVGLAVVGLTLVPRRRPGRDARTALAVGAAIFLLFGAPVILSGKPTFAGYVKLDDTATFLAFTDRVLDHGRDLSGLAPSSYEATLAVNIANGYPLGAVLPLGIGARLVGTDPAWVWQPLLSFAAAMLAMTSFVLARRMRVSRLAAAAASFGATSSALFYGYAQWGGIKELVAVPLLALGAVTINRTATEPRRLVFPAVAFAAFLAVMSLGGVVWVAPLAIAHVLVTRESVVKRAATGLVLLTLLSLPVLVEASAFLRRDNVTSFRAGGELGNLVRPLRVQQVLGIWPTADFRLDPSHSGLTALLLMVATLGLGLGVIAILKARCWELSSLVIAVALGAMTFVVAGSPWIGGKSLAMASPIVLLVVLLGFLTRSGPRWRQAGIALGAVVVVAVIASDIQVYRGVWLAPYDQLAELEAIGKTYAGQGPALMTEYQPYGVRHFLRRLDAEGASELRRRTVHLANGGLVPKGDYADIDAFDQNEIVPVYRLLVLRRSPVGSRPSSAYTLAARGAWYDVWRRLTPTLPRRIALGGPLDRNGVPVCADVGALAATARDGDRILTPESTTSTVAKVGDALPPSWISAGRGSGYASVGPTGEVSITLSAPTTGVFGVWIGGTLSRRLRVSVDGDAISTIGPQINQRGMWLHAGDVPLTAGPHLLVLRGEADTLRPGVTSGPFFIGPVALAQEPSGAIEQPAGDVTASLCGRSLDWIELVR